jgi:hypothetical protein
LVPFFIYFLSQLGMATYVTFVQEAIQGFCTLAGPLPFVGEMCMQVQSLRSLSPYPPASLFPSRDIVVEEPSTFIDKTIGDRASHHSHHHHHYQGPPPTYQGYPGYQGYAGYPPVSVSAVVPIGGGPGNPGAFVATVNPPPAIAPPVVVPTFHHQITIVPGNPGLIPPQPLSVRSGDQVTVHNNDLTPHKLVYVVNEKQFEFQVFPGQTHTFQVPESSSRFWRQFILSLNEPQRVYMDLTQST